MSDGSNLIFLISQPRAGSTLLQKILGGHTEIHTVSEPWIALHPLLALRRRGMSGYHCHHLAREATVEFLTQIPGGEETYFQAVGLMLNTLYDAVRIPSGKPIFLDKTPRYYFIVPELRRVFPEARFVFLVRNPLAVLASMLRAWVRGPYFANRFALRADLIHDLLTGAAVLADAIENPGANDAVVYYENLVESPASSLARLCARLRLAYQPEMMEYGGKANPRWAFGDQSTLYSETRPVTGHTEQWRQSLGRGSPTNELARSYLSALGPCLVERLGYNYDGLAAGLGVSGPVTKETPAFLATAIQTPAYGESCDYLSQAGHFEGMLRAFAASRRPVKKAAAL